jgi:hypothetical protein
MSHTRRDDRRCQQQHSTTHAPPASGLVDASLSLRRKMTSLNADDSNMASSTPRRHWSRSSTATSVSQSEATAAPPQSTRLLPGSHVTDPSPFRSTYLYCTGLRGTPPTKPTMPCHQPREYCRPTLHRRQAATAIALGQVSPHCTSVRVRGASRILHAEPSTRRRSRHNHSHSPSRSHKRHDALGESKIPQLIFTEGHA